MIHPFVLRGHPLTLPSIFGSVLSYVIVAVGSRVMGDILHE